MKSLILLIALTAVLAPLAQAQTPNPYDSCLFFSEYIEGSSYNKAVEIYNATEAAIDLSTVELLLYSNGGTEPSQTLMLEGMLPVGGVFVVAHGSADAAILAVADMTGGVINFNGDDALEMRLNGATVDVIGQIGYDPGTAWGTAPCTTVNATLVRMIEICCGDADGSDAFDPCLEWNGFDSDTFDYLGAHVTECQAVANEAETWGALKASYR